MRRCALSLALASIHMVFDCLSNERLSKLFMLPLFEIRLRNSIAFIYYCLLLSLLFTIVFRYYLLTKAKVILFVLQFTFPIRPFYHDQGLFFYAF